MSFYNQDLRTKNNPPPPFPPNGGGSGGGGTGSTFYTPSHQPQQFQSQQPQQPQQQAQQAQQQPQPQQPQSYYNYGNKSQQEATPKQDPPTPSFWNPAAASAVVSAATSGKGLSDEAMLDIASSALKYSTAQATAQVTPGIGRLVSTLRIYFAVDNRYVKLKMQRLMFPFLFKKWKRLEIDPATAPPDAPPSLLYAIPIHDENAFDLYLPLMSLITYVLLCAICHGTAGQFTPEVIPNVTSKCLITQTLEVISIRFGLYLLRVSSPFLDLFALTGYKYLGLCANMLLGMGFGKQGYYGALLYTAAVTSYFVLKVMANGVPKVTTTAEQTGMVRREFVVVGCAGCQFATMWFLGQTKFLV